MARKVRRSIVLILLLGFAPGCGGGQPEVKLDPVQAGKPFPKAGERQAP